MLVHRQGPGGRIPCALAKSPLKEGTMSNHLNVNYGNSKKSNKNDQSFRHYGAKGYCPETDGHGQV